MLAEKTQGLADAKKRGEELTIAEKHAMTEAQQDAAEAQRALAALNAQTEGAKPVEAVESSPEAKTVPPAVMGGSGRSEIDAYERLVNANKLLAEKTQGLANAKKRGDELTIEEKHALTEAQQDAAEAQKVLAALSAQTEGAKPVEAVESSPEAKTVPPAVMGGSGRSEIDAYERLVNANKLLAEKTQGLADAKKRGEELTIAEKHVMTEAQEDAAEAQRALEAQRSLAAIAIQADQTKPIQLVGESHRTKESGKKSQDKVEESFVHSLAARIMHPR
uniref:Uncharacterized protein n=1 Tax=Noctiluca scintillans TaxID=2966 RepID=A0A7S0ZZC1_NOCSC